MRHLYLILFVFCTFSTLELSGQSLYNRLKCEGPSAVTGPVSSMEVKVNPSRMDHRTRRAYFQYDGSGNLVEEEMKGERWEYIYDTNGRVKESRRYFKGFLQEVRQSQYRGDKMMEAIYESDGKTLIRSVFLELDESNRPVDMEVRFPNSNKKVRETARFGKNKIEIVQYADNGFKIVESHFGIGCIDHVMRRSTNVNGQLLRELVRRKTSSGVIFLEHIYQYDDIGNWTTQKTFRHRKKKSDLLQEVTRTINYRQI